MQTHFAIVVLASAAAYGQTFEVASIKPIVLDGRGIVTRSMGGPESGDPALFTCENCSLSELVMSAYGIESYRVSAPGWADDARFILSAKVPEGTSTGQFHLMQQNLLAERFKMKSHYEQKELPQYQLVAAKNGPKLKESAAGTLASGSAGQDGRAKSSFTIRLVAVSIAEFTRQLSSQLRRPVADATGLKGKYDITLQWISDVGSDGPTIFDALQQQLGLKLEERKTMVDVLVIDHVEKTPTEN
jgi:uncharacterized protein (TIGR03435 family)